MQCAVPAIRAIAAASMLILTAAAPPATLPRDAVLNIAAVKRYFADIAREASNGANATATGNPDATRGAIYTTRDGRRRVTVTLDRYATRSAALSAYEDAVRKSKIPGFKRINAPRIGERSFAGTVTRGAETHVGIGEVHGSFIIGATLAGYDASNSNIARLGALVRAQDAMAQRAATHP